MQHFQQMEFTQIEPFMKTINIHNYARKQNVVT